MIPDESAGLRFRLNLLQLRRHHDISQHDTVTDFNVDLHAVVHPFQNRVVHARLKHQRSVVGNQNLIIPVGIRFRQFISHVESRHLFRCSRIAFQLLAQVFRFSHRLATVDMHDDVGKRNLMLFVSHIHHRTAHFNHALRPRCSRSDDHSYG